MSKKGTKRVWVPEGVYDLVGDLGNGSAERGWPVVRELLQQHRPAVYVAVVIGSTIAQLRELGGVGARVAESFSNLPAVARAVAEGSMPAEEFSEAVVRCLELRRGFRVTGREPVKWIETGEGVQVAKNPHRFEGLSS